ncbi:class I SAM-dependent methyltransferase [Anabaena subtropica]|uniref:Methyltransferase domain-containing protein n=1 Tax=Anabaena subtropica FACHB-260 TaxID=2692884 RepID=A0ABR8CIQ2_9NOST|nr:class I SAM-dependent methyltransferase [Anabaena subtropica]MBD2342909.1 methyltransferase domain-containing protein [Anabaena subtropica FACHB-260]
MIQQHLTQNLEQIQTPEESICPNCSHQGLSIFYEVHNVPVHSCLMLSNQQEALDFPRGDILLGYCHHCGFITNLAYDPKWSAYAPNYEDQQSFSPTFNKFALDLANHLIKKHDLHNKDIMEIGCSKGDFLLLLCELGNNRGVGIDPSVVPGRVESVAGDRVIFIPEYYDQHHAQYVGDFICCRHTLEHIQPTAEFLQKLRHSIGTRTQTTVFFEVPDTHRVLKDSAFEDIYYEHCSYFTPGSLSRLFRNNGFAVTDLHRSYGNQYLLIEARPVAVTSDKIHPLEESIEQTASNVQAFASKIQKHLERWKRYLQKLQSQGKRTVIWGSGSKCVAFLTTLDAVDQVQYVVDINPHRQGKFIPGVGKEIVSPEFLRDYQPDHVIVMNSIYCQEIQQMLNTMGLMSEVIAL